MTVKETGVSRETGCDNSMLLKSFFKLPSFHAKFKIFENVQRLRILCIVLGNLQTPLELNNNNN